MLIDKLKTFLIPLLPPHNLICAEKIAIWSQKIGYASDESEQWELFVQNICIMRLNCPKYGRADRHSSLNCAVGYISALWLIEEHLIRHICLLVLKKKWLENTCLLLILGLSQIKLPCLVFLIVFGYWKTIYVECIQIYPHSPQRSYWNWKFIPYQDGIELKGFFFPFRWASKMFSSNFKT